MSQRILIVALIVCVLGGYFAWNAVSQTLTPRSRELKDVRLIQIDLQARTARVELKHPKTGRRIEVTGTAPPECPITIDGTPAELSDLRVGDRGDVHVTIVGYSVTANWVKVTRAETSASAPAGEPTSRPSAATQPAAGEAEGETEP